MAVQPPATGLIAVRMTWPAGTAAATMRLQRATNSGFSANLVDRLYSNPGESTLLVIDEGLFLGVTYWYKNRLEGGSQQTSAYASSINQESMQNL